jgi:hypothetical protein
MAFLLAACGETPKTSTPAGQSTTVTASVGSPVTASGKMRIALLLPLSGRSAPIGQSLQQAAEMALFDTGAKELALAAYDSGETADTAVEAYRKARIDGAALVLGPLFGTSATALAPLVNQGGANVVSFSNDEQVGQRGVWIMGIAAPPQVRRVVDHAFDAGVRRFAAFAPQTPYGQQMVQTMESQVTMRGGKVAAVELFDANSADLNTPARRLAEASRGEDKLAVLVPVAPPRLSAALAALAAAALFGLIPAVRAARPDVAIVLRGSSRNAGLGGGGWMRNTVVVIEVAMCFVLLVGSGLMFRTFQALQRVDPGFDPKGMLTFGLVGGNRGNQPPLRQAFMRTLEAKMRAIPGVQAVAASFPFPLTGGFSPIRWGLENALTDPSRFMAVDFQIVLPGYFEAMKTPLVAGRTFTEEDNLPTRDSVVVDTMLAAKAFPGQSALGKRILIRARGLQPEWVQIIGVVAHQRQISLSDPGREQLYITDGYLGHGNATRIGLRTAGDPAKLAPAVREAIAQQDKTLVMVDMQTMDTVVEKAQAGTRFQLLLIGVFAAIAALLAGVGLYGVLSTLVRQRTAEIGVRVAMGAEPATIFSLIVGQGLKLSALGVGVGLVAAYALTSIMSSMLFGVKATDPLTFASMVVLFLGIAAISSWLPARRAASLDPTRALRDE